MKYLITTSQGLQTTIESEESLSQVKALYSPWTDIQPVKEPAPVAEVKVKKTVK